MTMLAVAIAPLLMLSPAEPQLKESSPAVQAAVAAVQTVVDAAADVASPAEDGTAAYPGYFDPSRDAMADVDAALAAAQASGKHVLVVFGGDWCHDSAALMAAFDMPRTQAMLAARYEIAYVHIPFSSRERVLPVAQRFGIAEVEGTPTVLILRPDGTPTNIEDAPRWRNAASRKPAAIHRALERAAPAITP